MSHREGFAAETTRPLSCQREAPCWRLGHQQPTRMGICSIAPWSGLAGNYATGCICRGKSPTVLVKADVDAGDCGTAVSQT
jgi:hypothetical protein